MSAPLIVVGRLRCCVLHEGTRGPETGVRPVPPTINESKLNWIPAEGVLMGMPRSAAEVAMVLSTVAAVPLTLSVLGRLGFRVGAAGFNII